MSNIEKLPIDPIWRQAAINAVEEFQYGEIIPWEWLSEELQLTRPNELLTSDQFQKLQFEQLTRVDGFKEEMLLQYERYLVNVRGQGYRIVEPPHQTREAMAKLQKELRKAINDAMQALVNVNAKALTLDDARENADSRAKLAAFSKLHVRELSSATKPDRRFIEKK